MKENNAISVKEEILAILEDHPELIDDVKAKALELLEEQKKEK